MQKTLIAGAVLGALLLFGAGCATGDETQKESTEQGVNTNAAAQSGAPDKTGGTVDASVDAILKSSDDEQSEQMKVESEADEIGSDAETFNSYNESSYDIQ